VSPTDDVLALPFDQYQRYRLLADALERLRSSDERQTILDVGGSPGEFRRFLPTDRVLIADLAGEPPDFVRADGARLPFRDGQFPFVASSDTYEHIPPDRRQAFLRELARVASEAVVLGAPFDAPGVRQAEAALRALIAASRGQAFPFLEEHAAYGLPSLAELKGALAAEGLAHLALPNGYLPRWAAMLGLYFVAQWQMPREVQAALEPINRFYNSTFYAEDNREPCYRWVVVISHRPERLEQLGPLMLPPAAASSRENAAQLLELVMQAAGLSAIRAQAEVVAERDATIRDLQARLEEQAAWAKRSADEVDARDAVVRELHDLLAARDAAIRDLRDYQDSTFPVRALKLLRRHWRR